MTSPLPDGAFADFYRTKIVPKPSTVALAYCHGEVIRPAFMRSVVNTLVADRGQTLHGCITVEGLYIARSRNEVVGQFLHAAGCEWLWFLDTDIEFGSDVLQWLLGATSGGEKKIVAAPYWSIDDDGIPYCTWMGLEEGSLLPYRHIPEKGTVRVDACGMGCTLVHREVFLAIAKAQGTDDPWIWFGHDLIELDSGPTRLGEDITFCIRAAKAGYATWGVCGIEVNHLKIQATRIGKVVVDEPTQAT